IEDVVAALEAGRFLLPAIIRIAPLAKALHDCLRHRTRALVADAAAYRVQELAELRCRNLQLPARNIVLDLIRRSLETDDGLAGNIVESPIVEDESVVAENGLVILSAFVPRASAHLENINEIRFKRNLDQQFGVRLIEVRKGDRVVKQLRSQQLLAANVDCVFR